MPIPTLFPNLKTKEDYYLLISVFPKERWLPVFTQLLDDRYMWVQERELLEGETGQEDESHKVVEVPYSNGTTLRYQYTIVDNPSAKLYLLGFTVEEVQNIINF